MARSLGENTRSFAWARGEVLFIILLIAWARDEIDEIK
jgi:hypothetical protein